MQVFTVILLCAFSVTYKDYVQVDFAFLNFTRTLLIKCFVGYFNKIKFTVNVNLSSFYTYYRKF